jgi:ubiquinone/menaquinone biosynthesis C-methylase UbiE
MNILKRLANNDLPYAFGTKMRKNRHAIFVDLLRSIPPPVKILDVGGTESYWKAMQFPESDRYEIVVLNLEEQEITSRYIKSVKGNATSMKEIGDLSFDVVFSNSVIEHVGDFAAQRSMASEVSRIGKRYFIQTPNYWFPMEPHFLLPGYQWLPRVIRIWLIRHFNLGWYTKIEDMVQARDLVDHTRLLTKKEFQSLFPKAHLYEEKIFGITKSFISYSGWD